MKTHRVRPGLESGMYLVVVALGAALFVSLAALIVGVGFRSTGQSRLQYVTNLAVLSALEGLTESESTTYVQKANDAVQKANDVIRENPIPGLEGDLGTLTLSGSTVQPGAGVITFGKWFREKPPGEDPCQHYPCFVPGVTQTEEVLRLSNAVRLTFDTSSAASFNFPLCRVFGACENSASSSAVATLTQRCTAYVMDVSPSTFADSHRLARSAYEFYPNVDGDSNACDSSNDAEHLNPRILLSRWDDPCGFYYPAAFVLDRSQVLAAENNLATNLPGNNMEPAGVACQSGSVTTAMASAVIYCNMPSQRRVPVGDVQRSRLDYEPRTVYNADGTTQDLLVDVSLKESFGSIPDPQPFSSFLQAFNAGLQVVDDYKSAVDKALLIAFTGRVRGKFPRQGSAEKMAKDLKPMIQITNYNNLGLTNRNYSYVSGEWYTTVVSPEHHPNFLDYGFFTVPEPAHPEYMDSNTNIILGLKVAADALLTECPASAQKTIVLATDGISTCKLNGVAFSHADAANPGSYLCDTGSYQYFLDASVQLTDDVATYLKNQQISVVTLAGGRHIGPSFRNYRSNTGWLSPTSVSRVGNGFRGFTGSAVNNFNTGEVDAWLVDMQPVDPDSSDQQGAFGNLGREDASYHSPSVIFRLPNGVLSDLATRTGGIFCPLMPLCGTIDPDLYDGDNACNDTHCGEGYCYSGEDGNCGDVNEAPTWDVNTGLRRHDNFQYCSTKHESTAKQAARCVLESLGANPYTLVSEYDPPLTMPE